MTFLREDWYVAGWADEVKAGQMLAGQICDEPVVVYRGEQGAPYALFDRCPQRFAPLSKGVECEGDTSSVYLQTEMALTGTLQETGIQSPQGHLIIPASQNETHYVLSQAIPKALGEWAQGVVAQNITGLDELFTYEDKPMVEAQQRALAGKSFWEMKPVLLDVDAPAVRARRALEQMLATEPAGVATN